MQERKILIADSDLMLLSMLKFRLEQLDYEVIACGDGFTALEKIESDLPDVVVCEMMLPSVPGTEIITFVKNQVEKDIPVIILTTAGVEKVVVNAFELGAEDFIAKPFSAEELIIRISKAINHNIAEHKWD